MAGGSIFQGVTTAPCRDYLANEIFRYKPDRVYMPAAGRFGSAQAYIRHGGDPKKFFTSDIGLYSSMLGYLFNDSKRVSDLGIVNRSEIQPDSEDDLDVVTAVMLALKLGQIKSNNRYALNTRSAIIKGQAKLKESLKQQIVDLSEIMRGARYDIDDLVNVANLAKDDPNATIYMNVPTYSGGYEKMFSNSCIAWDEREFAQFSYSAFPALAQMLLESECHVILYVQKNLNLIPSGYEVIFAQNYSTERTDYLVSNRAPNKYFAVPEVKERQPKIYPIYNDEDITEDTEISFVNVDEATCLYYRDLFVHKLGTTTAESFHLMLIDGRVSTAFGLSMRDVYTGKSEYVSEVFGISKSSKQYKMLGKLFMLCLTSSDFKKYMYSTYNIGIRELKGVKTSSLTTFPEGKTDRSVMQLTFREQLPSGNYRLIYQGDFRDDTFADVLKVWLKRWGRKKRK